MHIIRSCFAVALIISSTSGCLSPTGKGSIKGTITSKEMGEPIVGATILVVGTTTGATTDPRGMFSISEVDPGTYTLRISHMNYATCELTDLVVKADSTVIINKRLTPRVTDLDIIIPVIGLNGLTSFSRVESAVTISYGLTVRPVFSRVDLIEKVPGIPHRTIDLEKAKAHTFSWPWRWIDIDKPPIGQSAKQQPKRTIDARLPSKRQTLALRNAQGCLALGTEIQTPFAQIPFHLAEPDIPNLGLAVRADRINIFSLCKQYDGQDLLYVISTPGTSLVFNEKIPKTRNHTRVCTAPFAVIYISGSIA